MKLSCSVEIVLIGENMSACKDFIHRIIRQLPELSDIKDLIKVGIFKSDQQAYNMRKYKIGPEYFKLNGRYYYPKEAIVKFLEGGCAEKK